MNKKILSYILILIWVLVSSFLVVLIVEFFYPEYGDPKYVQSENIFLVLPIIPRIIVLIIILRGISQIYRWGKKPKKQYRAPVEEIKEEFPDTGQHNPKQVEIIKEKVSNPFPGDTLDSVFPSISSINIDSDNNISGEDWICEKCNEKIDGNFDVCWNCTDDEE